MSAKTGPAQSSKNTIAVIVPCYRETGHIIGVLKQIGPEVGMIFVVDDCCPDGTGDLVEKECSDPRVRVLRHSRNKGVGGATVTGYQAALEAGADVLVKLDGDGQMDPALIAELVRPVVDGEADYAKGNRFHALDSARGMPAIRLIGNVTLTLMSKISSGYWSIMDPTNGFTALHRTAAVEIPLDDLAKGFFFESDMLYRLGGVSAVVRDVPMRAKYGAESSHLSIRKILFDFLRGHLRNAWHRLIDTYLVRDAGLATLELVFGVVMIVGGSLFGGFHWLKSYFTGVYATAGEAIIAAVPIIVGVQLLLAFVGQDVRREPSRPLQRR